MKNPICWWLIVLAASVLAYGLLKSSRTAEIEISGGMGVPDKKDAVSLILERLALCESGGNPLAIHKLDGDGTDSVGILQFKLATFMQEARRFGLFPYAEAADLENLWPDKESQMAVAGAMLRKDRANLRHWYICSKKVGAVL